MLEMAKKTILFGIGALSFTAEKGEKLVKELVEKGKLTQGEATQLVEGIMKKGSEEKEVLRALLQEELSKLQQATGFASRDKVLELEEKVKGLEEKLNALMKARETKD